MEGTIEQIPDRQVRAFYTDEFVRVYQAYSTTIAESAVQNKTFVSPPFSLTRMTWVKPSFLWMMYRCGWGHKDANQARILAVDITHEGFREMLSKGMLNHYDRNLYPNTDDWNAAVKTNDILIQWDPERDIQLNRLDYRTIQIGLRNQAVEKYCRNWIVNITDITDIVHKIEDYVKNGELDKAREMLPVEVPYPVSGE